MEESLFPWWRKICEDAKIQKEQIEKSEQILERNDIVSRMQLMKKMREGGLTKITNSKTGWFARSNSDKEHKVSTFSQLFYDKDETISDVQEKIIKKALTTQIKIHHKEVQVAADLAELSYHDGANEHKKAFLKQWPKVQILECQEPSTTQKYIYAVTTVGSYNVFFVAFAGTHLKIDWQTNLDIRATSSSDHGGSVHTGFLNRAKVVKYGAIVRLAASYDCRKIIFTGHSLGGAVAHLACANLLHEGKKLEFAKIRAYSCVFGAPYVALDAVRQNITEHDWNERFINFVNPLDPVPRLLNLTASFQLLSRNCGELAQDGAQLLRQCCSLMSGCVPDPSSNHRIAGTFLRFAEKIDTNEKVKAELEKRLDLYEPIGVYVLVEHSKDKRIHFVLEDRQEEVKDRLGGAKLITDRITALTGLINDDGVRRHDIKSYINNFRSGDDKIMSEKIIDLCCEEECGTSSQKPQCGQDCWVEMVDKDRNRGNPWITRVIETDNEQGTLLGEIPARPDPEWFTTQNVQRNVLKAKPEIHKVQIMPLDCGGPEANSSAFTLHYSIVGHDLDFVGESGILINPSGDSEKWGQGEDNNPKETIIDIMDARKLVFQECFPKRPRWFAKEVVIGEIVLRLKPDHGEELEFKFNQTSVITADWRWAPRDLPFNQWFLKKAIQLAWLSNHFGKPELLETLSAFEGLLTAAEDFPGRCLLTDGMSEMTTVDDSWWELGNTIQADVMVQRCQKWLCGTDAEALSVQSWLQKFGSVGMGVVIGGAVGGGIGVLLGGGFILCIVAVAAAAFSGLVCDEIFMDRVEHDYQQFLWQVAQNLKATDEDLRFIQVAPQMQKEDRVLTLFEKHTRADEFIDCQYAKLTTHYQTVMQNRLKAITFIHDMKKLMHTPLVSVCGMQNAGKTTLISQLLMNPWLSFSTGVGKNTNRVTPYRWGRETFLIDSPGTTSVSAIRKLFEMSSALMGKAYIYVRKWGQQEENDVKTIKQIMDRANEPSPRILVLLTHVVDSRRHDAGDDGLTSVAEIEEHRRSFLESVKDGITEAKLDDFRAGGEPMKSDMETRCRKAAMDDCQRIQVEVADLIRTPDELYKELIRNGEGEEEVKKLCNIVWGSVDVANWCKKSLSDLSTKERKNDLSAECDDLEGVVAKIDLKKWRDFRKRLKPLKDKNSADLLHCENCPLLWMKASGPDGNVCEICKKPVNAGDNPNQVKTCYNWMMSSN